MTTEKDYVERLEKIIDKQDELLSQLDSKFNQQDSLNESLAKQNRYLKEEIQKHKNLTRDMNKTVAQHKNVVANLKKELEGQLKIQQDLHRDYGEVIKNLTDDLEEQQNKNEELTKKQSEMENEISKLKDDLAKAKEASNVSTNNTYYDSFNKTPTMDSKLDNTDSPEDETKKCPNCGAEVQEGYLFCESCGTKL